MLWGCGMKVVEPLLLNDSTVLEIGGSSEYDSASTLDVRKMSGEILWYASPACEMVPRPPGDKGGWAHELDPIMAVAKL